MGRKTETVGSIYTVIQLSITAYMNLVCVCVCVEGAGGLYPTWKGFSSCSKHGNETYSKWSEVCLLYGRQTVHQELVSINKSGSGVANTRTHTHTPTHLLTPPSKKRLSAFTSAKRHSQRSLLPKNATAGVDFPLHGKNGSLRIIFDCKVRRVSVVKMLIFFPNHKTWPG